MILQGEKVDETNKLVVNSYFGSHSVDYTPGDILTIAKESRNTIVAIAHEFGLTKDMYVRLGEASMTYVARSTDIMSFCSIVEGLVVAAKPESKIPEEKKPPIKRMNLGDFQNSLKDLA